MGIHMDQKETMATTIDIGAAIAAFMPLLKVIIDQAEGTGASGADKHAAVAVAAEELYKDLQASGSIKEIQGVPWEAVAPLVVGAGDIAVAIGGGIIGAVVRLFKKLLGWGAAPAAVPAS